MAIITPDQINFNSENDFQVGFFSLKNDGDEAIVRIMCDSMADLEIMTVHPITVGASSFPNRQVNCLRDPRDPLDMCPLCAAGEKVKQKVFIRMLQYDPYTKEAKAVVWDRVASVFAPKIKSFLDNYGPLSHIMCKIIRHGTGKQTQYDIIPNINPMEFNEQNYPIVPDAFADFTVLGRMVMDKNAEEIMEFMRTGSFPEKQQNPVQTEMPQQQFQQAPPQQTFSAPPQFQQPQMPGSFGDQTPFEQTVGEVFGGNSPNLERPTRY